MVVGQVWDTVGLPAEALGPLELWMRSHWGLERGGVMAGTSGEAVLKRSVRRLWAGWQKATAATWRTGQRGWTSLARQRWVEITVGEPLKSHSSTFT